MSEISYTRAETDRVLQLIRSHQFQFLQNLYYAAGWNVANKWFVQLQVQQISRLSSFTFRTPAAAELFERFITLSAAVPVL